MPVKYRNLVSLSVLTATACLLGGTAPLACSAGNPTSTKGASGSHSSAGAVGNAGASAGGASGGNAGASAGGASGDTGTSGAGTTAGAAGAGTSGSTGTAGASGAGTSGSTSTAGASGAGTSGSTSTAGASGAGTSGAAGSGTAGVDAGNCNNLTIVPTPVTPTVLLLVDTSSSMWEGGTPPWTPLFNALMNASTGVVKPLQAKIRFGFTSYFSVNNGSMCPQLNSVNFALNNYDAINTLYSSIGQPAQKNETPTGESITAMAKKLHDFVPPAGEGDGPRYIVLVTDGNPDTCIKFDPQCGEDGAIKATQDAYASGIGLFPIGIGDILTSNAGCSGRCGTMHLQDLANAGSGLPVEPSTANINDGCTPTGQKATYTTAGGGGNAKFYTAANQTALQTALSGLLNGVASCSFEMNAIVTGNAGLGTVLVGTTKETYNDPNGWKLEDDNFTVTLMGTACDLFKAGASNVDISFPCDPGVVVVGR